MHSIGAMLKTVSEEYTIDQDRIFVSGLSDGGTFAYALGLHCPQVFAGIAPVAGILPRSYELTQAKTLPVLIVHGAQDFIFPVAAARATYASLKDQGFTNLSYTELPDWGHAYTYSIDETLVQPWFAELRRASSAAPKTGGVLHSCPLSLRAPTKNRRPGSSPRSIPAISVSKESCAMV